MTELHDSCDAHGGSAWVVGLTRRHLATGELRRLVDRGARGVVVDHAAVQDAMVTSADYDEQFAKFTRAGSVEDAYWAAVLDDTAAALDVLRPLHDASDGCDGFVSLPVAPPPSASDAQAIEASARWISAVLDQPGVRPNSMVGIPATARGVAAARRMVAEGLGTDVGPLFGPERYADVVEAYLAGLEALVVAGGDPSRVRGVATFDLGPLDAEVDRRLEAVGTEAALALRGRAAAAQAQAADELFRVRFSGERWEALARRGARPQRLAWAAGPLGDPRGPRLLRVGPAAAGTTPGATPVLPRERGALARTLAVGRNEARRYFRHLADLGVVAAEVAQALESEHAAASAESFDRLLARLRDKADALHHGAWPPVRAASAPPAERVRGAGHRWAWG